ncbi:hypothetical protein D3C81_1595190 [compost metagenome]
MFEGLGPNGPANIVDEDVEAAEGLDRSGHDPGTIAVLLQVGGEGQHALPGQFVDQLGAVHRHHLRAFGLEPPAHAPANTLGSAGDQGDFALKSCVHQYFSMLTRTLWERACPAKQTPRWMARASPVFAGQARSHKGGPKEAQAAAANFSK